MDKNGEEVSLSGLFIPLTTKKAIIFIIIIGIFVFFNALFNPFIGDDKIQILQNPLALSISNIPSFFTSNAINVGGGFKGIYYKPILYSVFSIITSVFSTTPFFYHFVQVALHITNAIFVLLFFRKFIKLRLAFFLSLIFLVHPINSESVIYISAMQETLFFFFGMVSLLILTKNHNSLKSLFYAQLFFLLSLLSKETGILFVLIAGMYVQLFKKNLMRIYAISSAIMFTFYLFMHFILGGVSLKIQAVNPILHATLFERIISMPAIFYYYIKTFIFPNNLVFDQQWVVKQINFPSFFLPLILDFLFLFIFILITVLTIKYSKRKYLKLSIIFFLWFILGFLLHSQIIPLDATVTDRWFYFPIVGLLGVIGLGTQTLLEYRKIPNSLILALGFSVILLLSFRTIIRNSNWSDPILLYTHDLALMPPNSLLEGALAAEYQSQNNLPAALIHAQKAEQIYPTYLNLTLLGTLSAKNGNIKKAEEYYIKATQMSDYYLAYENLSFLSAYYDPADVAKKIIVNAIKKFPSDSNLYIYLAVAAYRYGDVKDAKIIVSQACKISYNTICVYVTNQIENNKPINLTL